MVGSAAVLEAAGLGAEAISPSFVGFKAIFSGLKLLRYFLSPIYKLPS